MESSYQPKDNQATVNFMDNLTFKWNIYNNLIL